MSDEKPITVYITRDGARVPVILVKENGVLYSAILSPTLLSQEEGLEITRQAEEIYRVRTEGVVQ